ncbi:uncharacterized protein LOC121731997 isoform X2 [Aricia agestis]|uniref:uncharacterized protein LOC121731997 isoform X2 n=1 Tax=Aricia agestis TaxID=91739 RepID=UPI001C20B0C7|nr:uncharacterized protein LOC121731997 isoform X2 [Aricia agestis]
MEIKGFMTRCFFLVNVALILRVASASQIGTNCRNNNDCNVPNAHCQKGVCACQPYFANLDNSTCIESTLLGAECVVSEQCSLRVAYSACLEGVCRCTDGHLQFRKHTCLSPAAPGHVCYSNEHCRLWDKESHCEFVIRDLIGRCACNSYFKQVGSKCFPHKVPFYATEQFTDQDIHNAEVPIANISVASKNANKTINIEDDKTTPANADTAEAKPSNLPMFTSKNDVLSTQEDSPLMQAVLKVPSTVEPAKRPISVRKDGDNNELINLDEMTASLHANDQPIYRVVTQPSVDKKNAKKGNSKEQTGSKTQKSPQKKTSKDKQRVRLDGVVPLVLGPVSLGMPCYTDEQCSAVDANARCVNKRCDCAFRTNSTSACSARNRGCLPGTFQCKSTGTCISWYFVCDGRNDCPDGSDEKCQDAGERCPMHAFRCGGPGSPCVSRAARCDGTQQCPGGEDEKNCRATRRRGCPRHTFRCGSGECLPEYEFCNAIISCKDGSDEPSYLCNSEHSRWRAAEFCPLRCGNGRCRSTAVACSGRDGCGDNSDEIACSVCKCPAPPESP